MENDINNAIKLISNEAEHYQNLADGMRFKTENNLKWLEYKAKANEWKDALETVKKLSEKETAHWVYDENGNDWNIPAWTCSKCHHKNDMLPTCIRISANETKKVENPHMFAGSQFCPCCGAMMIESEVDKGI